MSITFTDLKFWHKVKFLKIFHGSANHSFTRKYEVEIIHENGTKINCYDNDPNEFGWCGVCDPEAEKGQPGFCEQKIRGQNVYDDYELNEVTETKPDKSWGWCSRSCLLRQIPDPEFQTGRKANLQVGFVNILAKKDCVG